METRLQMAQVLGQGKVATATTVVKQLIRLGTMVPVTDAIHQQ